MNEKALSERWQVKEKETSSAAWMPSDGHALYAIIKSNTQARKSQGQFYAFVQSNARMRKIGLWRGGQGQRSSRRRGGKLACQRY